MMLSKIIQKNLRNEIDEMNVEEMNAEEDIMEVASSVDADNNEQDTNKNNVDSSPLSSLSSIMDLVYPVGTVYSRNINELPFDFGKWEPLPAPIDHNDKNDNYEEDDGDSTDCMEIFKWIRIF